MSIVRRQIQSQKRKTGRNKYKRTSRPSKSWRVISEKMRAEFILEVAEKLRKTPSAWAIQASSSPTGVIQAHNGTSDNQQTAELGK